MHARSVTSVMSDSAISCTVAHQGPLSMGFSQQEYWSGLPCPPPGDLSDPGIKPRSLKSPALQGCSLPLASSEKPREFGEYQLVLVYSLPCPSDDNSFYLLNY